MLIPIEFMFAFAEFLSVRVVVFLEHKGWPESSTEAELFFQALRSQKFYIQALDLNGSSGNQIRALDFCQFSHILVVDIGSSFNYDNVDSCFHKGIHWIVAENHGYIDPPGTMLRLDSNFYTLSQNNIITEWYSLNAILMNSHFGKWEGGNRRLVVPVQAKWNRRKNFEGITLEVGTLPFPRAVVPVKTKGNSGMAFTGWVAEILAFVGQEYNFTINWTYPKDRVFGTGLENETWTGLIGMMQSKEVDMVATAMIVTKERGEVMYFVCK